MTGARVALVSGANRGIGLEAARQLARLGLKAVIGSRSPEKGEAARLTLKDEGLDVETVALDVADAESVRSAVAGVKDRFGRLDALVNNAGILLDRPGSEVSGNALEVPSAVVLKTFENNTLGPLRLIQAAAPLMRDQGYGRIVNVSSGAGQLAEMQGGYTAYRISKAAMNAVTRASAAEFPPAIKVNSVCPGWVRTDMGGANADRTVEKGAETIVWLATLPDDGPTGGFFRDKRPIPW